MLEFIQKSFLGGMKRQIDPTRLSGNEYFLGVNIRNRRDILDTIKEPKLLTNLDSPSGFHQGLFSAGSFLLVFIDGKCYAKDFENSNINNFTPISNFQMNPIAPEIFVEFIPAASIPYLRTFNSSNGLISNPIQTGTSEFKFDTNIINGSPAAAIVQDGMSQPRLIFANGASREIQRYIDWKIGTNGAEGQREYVPVGKQMIYVAPKLYIVSADGKELFHSVTGRPLDFVIPVDKDGNKIDPSEVIGGAKSTSHKIDFDSITTIKRISVTSKGFFASTLRNSYIISPNFDFPIYNEPSFDNQFLFPTGALNNNSFVDLNGDSGLIDFGGIRSFNTTLQLFRESSNLPLSGDVFDLFQDIVQDITCAENFDNYAFFAINTIYGRGVLVYDNLTQKFVSLDIYTGIGAIKKFAEVRTTKVRKFFFITTDNKLYEAFGSLTTAPAKVYIGEWCSNNPSTEQTPDHVNLVFADSSESGKVDVTLFTDRKKDKVLSKTIDKTLNDISIPQDIPFGDSSKDRVQNFSIDFKRGRTGWKLGYLISWNAKASLTHVRVSSNDITSEGPGLEQLSRDFVRALNGN